MKSLTKRDLAIDWKKFSSIDIKRFYDQISNNESLVNQFGANIAFCSTDEEFVRLFIILLKVFQNFFLEHKSSK
jgi:hypothetical protein